MQLQLLSTYTIVVKTLAPSQFYSCTLRSLHVVGSAPAGMSRCAWKVQNTAFTSTAQGTQVEVFATCPLSGYAAMGEAPGPAACS